MHKAIATPPNQPTLHIDLSVDELAQIDLDLKNNLNKKISKLPERIKEIAGQKILDIAPEWKQRNMLAGAIDLVEVNGSRSQDQNDKLQEYQDIWTRVESIRAYSDALEADVAEAIASGGNPELIDIESGWPE